MYLKHIQLLVFYKNDTHSQKSFLDALLR